MQIKITANDNETQITGPYSDQNNASYRARGGKFGVVSKSWVLRSEQANPLIDELFGATEDTVTVKVPVSHADVRERGGCLQIGGYVLASRRGRDYHADIIAPLVDGTIPHHGGSTKHPSVNASADAVFELECRRDFAERHGLINGSAPAPADAPAIDLSTIPTEVLAEECRRRGLLL